MCTYLFVGGMKMKNLRMFLVLFITIIVLILGLKISKVNSNKKLDNAETENMSRRANSDIVIFFR